MSWATAIERWSVDQYGSIKEFAIDDSFESLHWRNEETPPIKSQIQPYYDDLVVEVSNANAFKNKIARYNNESNPMLAKYEYEKNIYENSLESGYEGPDPKTPAEIDQLRTDWLNKVIEIKNEYESALQ